jgi:hypothetical protein
MHRMKDGFRGLAVASLALAPLLGGCATGSNATEGAATAAVEVRNDLIPPTSLTIYLVPESGVRRLLGNVGPSQTRVLAIRDPMPGQHRLMGRTTGGNEIYSNRINVGVSDTLRWDLSSNIVTGEDDVDQAYPSARRPGRGTLGAVRR